MKTVLIIDESPQFREYMRLKLEENDVEAPVAAGAMEGVTKTKNLHPDLIILDYHLSQNGYMEVLKQKKLNLHTAKTPVIILTQQIDQKEIIELVPYNVKKVFTKPVKIDALFAAVSELLGIPFKMDKSPGIMEVHVNEDIIFIEISKGLNADKLDLLKFKILELIELYQIRVPKVIIMIFDITLSHVDAPDIMKLIETVIHASRARFHYIRVLTRDEFVKKFLDGQKEYQGIGIVDNLQSALEGLLSALNGPMEHDGRKAEIIGDKVLVSKGSRDAESVTLRFDAESRALTQVNTDTLREILQNSRIAVVDDDFVILELIKKNFENLGASVKVYADGADYLEELEKEKFDLIFLDLLMPRADGFVVLQAMQARGIVSPVIVLSSVTQRKTVIQAFQMGVKSYLPKPLKPADIFKKAIEILKPGL